MVFFRFTFLLVVLLALSANAADPASPFSLVTPAKWVMPLDETKLAAGPDKTFGIEYLLVDRQVNAAEQASFSHITYRITADAGLQRGSQITIDYDPAYESIDWHFINLIRDGKVLDRFNAQSIKVIQQERDLDRHMYNGQLTALLMIDDVRVGDVIDYATTRRGANPIFAGAYLDAFYAGWFAPVRHQRARLMLPVDRPLYFKIHQPDSFGLKEAASLSNPDREQVWEGRDLKPLVVDDQQPAWFNPLPFIQVSEYKDWRSVIDWAVPLYSIDEPLTPDMKAKLDELLAGLITKEEKVVAVLDFVQREIRYLGIEMGPRSHQPHPASEVFARRFGDCKDKTRLFCTLLHAIGIEAYPALVHSTSKHTLRNWIPSPYAFDHVIARVTVNAQTWWLDPTLSYQRGILKRRSALNYGPALVLAPGETDLVSTQPHSPLTFGAEPVSNFSLLKSSASPFALYETVDKKPIPEEVRQHILLGLEKASPPPLSPLAEPPPNETFLRTSETYDMSKPDGPHGLEVVTTYDGRSADSIRAYLANTSRSDIEKNLLNFYARLYPDITAKAAPQWEDIEPENKIILKESYVIPQLWESKDGITSKEATFAPVILYDYTTRPESPKRTTPLAVRHPVNIDVTTTVKLHKPWALSIPETLITHDAFSYKQSIAAQNNTVTMTFQWRSKQDHVSAAATSTYAAKLEEVRNRAGYYLTFDPVLDKSFEHYLPNWLWIILFPFVALAVCAFVRWLWRKQAREAEIPGAPPVLDGIQIPAKPIGGWLGLLAVGVVVRPFYCGFKFLFLYGKYFDRREWINLYSEVYPDHALRPLIIFEGLSFLSLTVLSFACLVAFFQHRRVFPVLMKLNLGYEISFILTGIVTSAIYAKTTSGTDYASLFGIFITSLWLVYLFRSKRVKATFTR